MAFVGRLHLGRRPRSVDYQNCDRYLEASPKLHAVATLSVDRGRPCPPSGDACLAVTSWSSPHVFSSYFASSSLLVAMSFFKRNDPNAPAARRAANSGGTGPYERLPVESAHQPNLPPRRSPAPPTQPDFSTPYQPQRPPQQPAAQHPSYGRGIQPQTNAYDAYHSQDYPTEKSEHRSPARGMQGSASGRGLFGIAPCPSDPLALTNRLVVNPGDFPPDVEFVILRDRFVLSIM
jgi:hypothetical protein